jgi:hypothetical protein
MFKAMFEKRSVRAVVIVGVLGGVAGGVMLSREADAGAKSNSQVIVNATQRYAQGDLGAAHNSADSTQYIGCSIIFWGPGSGLANQAICTARSAANVYLSCSTTNADFIAMAGEIKGDSFLFFSVDAAGLCNQLQVDNSSMRREKQP